MHGGADRRHPHHLRAAPGDRPDIARLQAVGLATTARVASSISLARPGDLVVEQAGGVDQALAVGGQAEDAAVIDALALEDGRAVMQGMGQHMHAAVAPGDEPCRPAR